jgi:hypothetical protein
MSVCLTEDDFTRAQADAGLARWEALLSDGMTVLQDDGRPGVERSAWLRLKAHVHTHNLNIDRLSLRFRGRVENMLPDYAQGYYFSHNPIAVWGLENTLYFYLVGFLTDGLVRLERWKVPELILTGREDRPAQDAGRALIVNQGWTR